MPYCHKCGAELEKDAGFCHVCGAPAKLPTVEERTRCTRRHRRPLFTLGMVMLAILVTAMIVGIFVFLPIQSVNVNQSEGAPYQSGIDVVNVDFKADIARVRVVFEDLAGKLVTLNVTATGGVGILVGSNVLNISFTPTFSGNALTVTSNVETLHSWPWLPWLNVVCTLRIDPSMNVSLKIKTTVGGIAMDTRTGVTLNTVSLEATTGGVEANLVKGVATNGNILVKSTTGGVRLLWDNAKASNNISINTETTTGDVTLDVVQNTSLPANVTINARSTTGGVDLAMSIHDDIGAAIESTVTIGGIDIRSETGFSGTNSALQSTNYPADSNFKMSLRTTTGGIEIDAEYTIAGGPLL